MALYLIDQNKRYANAGIHILALLDAARHWHEDFVISARVVMFVPPSALRTLRRRASRQRRTLGGQLGVIEGGRL